MADDFLQREMGDGTDWIAGGRHRTDETRPSFLTFARGVSYLVSGLQGIAAVFRGLGLWFLAIGLSSLGSDSLEERLAAFWIVFVLAPFPILWLLAKQRNRAAAVVFLIEAAALMPLAWNPSRNEFEWGYFAIAGVLTWIACALIAGDRIDRGPAPRVER